MITLSVGFETACSLECTGEQAVPGVRGRVFFVPALLKCPRSTAIAPVLILAVFREQLCRRRDSQGLSEGSRLTQLTVQLSNPRFSFPLERPRYWDWPPVLHI